jgi:hypothetical protein
MKVYCSIFLTAAVLLCSSQYALSATVQTLCQTMERPVFSCATTNGEVVSLCAVASQSPNAGFRYRSGRDHTVDYSYPVVRDHSSRGEFRFSWRPYSGGGEYHVRFVNGAHEYLIYDYETRNATYAGLFVKKDGRDITHLLCLDTRQTHLNEREFGAIAKERFVQLQHVP